MSAASLLFGLGYGLVGFVFFNYGRKQSAVVPMLCGLALMIVPYLTDNSFALAAIGALLMLIPYFVRL